MQNPPDLAIVTTVLTSAGANVGSTGIILAAPGAGFRYRIWRFQVSPYATAQAVGNWSIALTNSAITANYGRIARPNFMSASLEWPGGYPTAVNSGFGFALQSTLAALDIELHIYYTTERVT